MEIVDENKITENKITLLLDKIEELQERQGEEGFNSSEELEELLIYLRCLMEILQVQHSGDEAEMCKDSISKIIVNNIYIYDIANLMWREVGSGTWNDSKSFIHFYTFIVQQEMSVSEADIHKANYKEIK